MNLTDRVNGSQLDQKIRDILDHMQQGTYDVNALESVKIFHNTQDHLQSPHTHYLGGATPFARMWTAVEKMGQRYTENGELILKQKKGDDYYFFPTEDGEPIFDDTGQKRAAKIKHEDIQKYPREALDHVVYEIGNNFHSGYNRPHMESMIDYSSTPRIDGLDNTYLKPPMGITSISERTDGPLGAIKYTTVNFTVHNHTEFERIIQPWFLQPGTTIGVDYGWSNIGSHHDLSELYSPTEWIKNGFHQNLDFETYLYGTGYAYSVDYSPGIVLSLIHI